MIRIIAILLAGLALPALAQNAPKSLGSFEAWGAFVFAERGAKTCYMMSEPVSREPKALKRAEVYIMVAHRNGAKVADEVSIYGGYPFKKDSGVKVRIQTTDYDMFTHGDTAWARDSAGDKALVAAMKAGKDLQVTGLTNRDAKLTDTYSLVGFSAAYGAISKECLGK
jgi:hypothetical protein